MMEFQHKKPEGDPPTLFDGVLSDVTDGQFELLEQLVGAIGNSLPEGHALRNHPVISRFCTLTDGCAEMLPKLPGIEWEDGQIAGHRDAAPDLEAASRQLAYQMAALLQHAEEAATILEQHGIPVRSRYVPR